MKFPRLIKLVGGVSLLPCLVLSFNELYEIKGVANAFVNSIRAGFILIESFCDYRNSLSGLTYNTDDYHAARSKAHTRTAIRILKLSEVNKGIYLKLGQYVGTLERMVPPEFTQTLKVLQDSVAPIPYSEIKKVFKMHPNTNNLEQIFDIGQKAVAAASLAQVHVGRNKKTGEKVAIKMQYPFLLGQSAIDFKMLGLLISCCNQALVYYKNYDIDLLKIFDTWTSSLIQELDFSNEVGNAERTRRNFKKYPYLYIPKYYQQLSSNQVIVMEYIDGIKINDVAQLKANGIDPLKVSHNLIEIFAMMFWTHRFVHCDVHQGNIFVRKQSNAIGHDIVLIDHGLYKSLREDTVYHYSGLWINLMQSNKQQVLLHAEKLNLQKHLQYLPLIFLGRTMGSTKKFGEKFNKAERDEFRAKDLSNFDSINQVLYDLPDELLFVIKANVLISIHSFTLAGGQRYRLFEYMKYSLGVVHPGKLAYCAAYLILRTKIWLFEHFIRLYRWLFGTMQ